MLVLRKAFFKIVPVIGIHPLPVRHQPRLAVVDESAEEDAVVPVLGEVFQLAVGEDGLEPGQHELLGREVGGAELVVGNEGPDQAQDQLQVAVVDVGVAWEL